MFRPAFSLLFLLFAFPVYAQSPVIYARSGLSIITMPQIPPETPAEKTVTNNKAEKEKPTEKVLATSPKRFDFTVQEKTYVSLLNETNFISGVTDGKHGVLYTLEKPEVVVLQYAPIMGAVDVLTIAPTGRIEHIYPSLKLSEMTAAIRPTEVTLAVLHLKAGTTEALGIHSGDTVLHSAFTPAPAER